jgi:Salmonella virulence plasmid 65kDa B protein/Insecticide toxin TcdB middle/N-terminal region/FG-GAP-like repeat
MLRATALSIALVLFTPQVASQTTVAGFTPGSFRVTESGSAEYRIPLKVPPGIAGMEPKLALVYDSQAGNGLLGVGWNLEGLSAITRCPRTMAQDGVRGGVNYDWNDRYCLDGQRLILVSGASYGGDGAEYRTERESFSKVISYGVAGNGPAWFRVWTKGGQILEYGNTADSRIEAQGKPSVRVWAVNKMSDTKGNSIVLNYFEYPEDGIYLPASIVYSNASLITFGYAGRPDVVPGYVAGSKIVSMHLMTQIRTFVGNLVRDYRLSFAQGPGTLQSRLKDVQECTGDGLFCFPLTTFGWQNGDTGYAPWTWQSTSIGSVNGYEHYFADVNGDGRADWIQVARGSNNGYVGLSNPDGSIQIWTWQSTQIGAVNSFQHYFADVNGDGKADWIQVARGSNNGYVGLSNGDASFPTWTWHSVSIGSVNGYEHYFADVNGDGRADWIQVARGSNNGYVGLSNGDGSFQTWTWHSLSIGAVNSYQHYFADVNGDGKADWIQVARGSNNGYIGLSNGDASFSTWTWQSPSIGSVNGYEHHFADVNGDGRADWIQIARGSNNGYVGLSKGDGSVDIWTWQSDQIGAVNSYQHDFADVNGDGRADWIQVDRVNNNGYLGSSNGNASFPTWSWHHPWIGAMSGYEHYHADLNGDGKADWIQVARGSNNGYVGIATGMAPDLLTAINSGAGASATVTYQPITTNAIYTKDSDSIYPRLDIQAPMYVVTSTQADNGIGAAIATSYVYGGLKAELGTGRGSLGFRWMETATPATGLKTRTDYRQDWPYVGLPSLSRTTQVSGALLRQVTNTHGCTNPATSSSCTVAPGNRYFPFVSQSVESGNDLNGALLPTVSTTTQYDAFGNAESIVVSSGDGHGKTTSNVFVNDVPNWLLGRLRSSSVQSTVP